MLDLSEVRKNFDESYGSFRDFLVHTTSLFFISWFANWVVFKLIDGLYVLLFAIIIFIVYSFLSQISRKLRNKVSKISVIFCAVLMLSIWSFSKVSNNHPLVIEFNNFIEGADRFIQEGGVFFFQLVIGFLLIFGSIALPVLLAKKYPRLRFLAVVLVVAGLLAAIVSPAIFTVCCGDFFVNASGYLFGFSLVGLYIDYILRPARVKRSLKI